MIFRKSLFVLALALVGAPLLASEITAASVVRTLNVYRALHRLAPVVEDPRLDLAAEDRMREMEELEYWGHQSPGGKSAFFLMQKHGYHYVNAGENLANGFETVEMMVESWMESPGHRENILSPRYMNVGIAIIDGATSGRAPGKSVVLLFGREMVEPISPESRPRPPSASSRRPDSSHSGIPRS